MADESFIVVHELTEDFDLEKELFEDEVDLMMLSAVSCFMRRDLNRMQDYFELTQFPATGKLHSYAAYYSVCFGSLDQIFGMYPRNALEKEANVATMVQYISHGG